MDQGIYWYFPGEFHLPYMQKIYTMTDTTIVFMGRFYLEPETLPIEAVLYISSIPYKCIITHKDFINDEFDLTRDFTGCPRHYLQCETIQIKYKNIGRLEKTPEDDAFFNRAIEMTLVRKRNDEYIRTREERERRERREKWAVENPELAARLAAAAPKAPTDTTHKNGI